MTKEFFFIITLKCNDGWGWRHGTSSGRLQICEENITSGNLYELALDTVLKQENISRDLRNFFVLFYHISPNILI